MSEEANDNGGSLKERDVIATVMSAMIGAGISLTPGLLARQGAPPWLIIVLFVAVGGIVLCGALVLAELANVHPGNGGPYQYLTQRLGGSSAMFGPEPVGCMGCVEERRKKERPVPPSVGSGMRLRELIPRHQTTPARVRGPHWAALNDIHERTRGDNPEVHAAGGVEACVALRPPPLVEECGALAGPVLAGVGIYGNGFFVEQALAELSPHGGGPGIHASRVHVAPHRGASLVGRLSPVALVVGGINWVLLAETQARFVLIHGTEFSLRSRRADGEPDGQHRQRQYVCC